LTDNDFLLRFAVSLNHITMAELTVSKTVEGLRIETDFKDLKIRVYRSGSVIREIDCRAMSLARYMRTVNRITAEALSGKEQA